MRWLAAGVVLFVLLAGCGGKKSGANEVHLGDGQDISLDLPEEDQPAPDDIRGAVSGIVIDDAVYPIPAAKVAIVGRDIQAVADEQGLFSFLDMAPGLYTVQATKDGHAAGIGTINVKSGEVTKAILMATRLPYQGPYHITHSLEEFRSANPLDDPAYHVVALDMKAAGAVIESTWEGLQAVTEDPLEYTVTAESNTTARLAGSGANPLRLELEADWFPQDEYAVRVQVVPTDASLPPDIMGRTYVTLFYIDPPPSGWSFLEGDL